MTQRDKSSEEKQVTFTGAAMADDRIHALELEMAKLSTQLNQNQSDRPNSDSQNPQNRERYNQSPSGDRGVSRWNYGNENRYCSPTPNRGRYESRYPSRDSFSRDSRNSGFERSRYC